MGKRTSHNVNWKEEGNILKAVYDNYIFIHAHKLKHIKKKIKIHQTPCHLVASGIIFLLFRVFHIP